MSMRRTTMLAGAVALAVGAVAVGARSTQARQAWAAASHGAAPGRLGSWLSSQMDGPSYRAMAEALDLRPDDVVLDVACGWGEFLHAHAAGASRVAGADIAPAKVELARQRLANRVDSGTAEVVVADAAQLPWPDGSFTAVTCMNAFPFFSDPKAVLAEMYRVLRPAGRVVVSLTATSEAAARGMVEAAGFDHVDVSRAPTAGQHGLISRALHLLRADEMDVVVGFKPVAPPGRTSGGTSGGKYGALARLLGTQARSEVQLTFDEISDAVPGGLPPSAYKHASWWANDASGRRVQARAWMAAGWRTSHVDVKGQEVTFAKEG